MRRNALVGVCILLVSSACGDDGGAATSAPRTIAVPTTTVPAGATSTFPPSVATTTIADDGVFSIEVTQNGGFAVLAEGDSVDVGARIAVPSGAVVRLAVTLAAGDEVHVHGYDLAVDAALGVTAMLEFTADIPGIFEVELEGARILLFELEVS